VINCHEKLSSASEPPREANVMVTGFRDGC
jgi:hypothetical protein